MKISMFCAFPSFLVGFIISFYDIFLLSSFHATQDRNKSEIRIYSGLLYGTVVLSKSQRSDWFFLVGILPYGPFQWEGSLAVYFFLRMLYLTNEEA